ncbi:unnamed protein product [Absidia cylindrospora]
MTDEVTDVSSILAPLFNIFSLHQIETLLYAYLPNRLDCCFEKTGIYSVDTFIVNAIEERIAIVIDSVVKDDYRSTSNIYHQAIRHLLSIQAQKKSFGVYNLKPTTDIDKISLEPPPFYMIPQPQQVDVIEHEGLQIEIAFLNVAAPSTTPAPTVGDMVHGLPLQSKEPDPPIRISTTDKIATVATLSTFLDSTAKIYLMHMDSERNKRARARYEYITQQAKWTRVCALHNNGSPGLSTVALCPENEHRLLKDLDTFVNNKSFYKRVGFPFRRGYLLHGQPGTGKTSLVLAVASYLQLSLYFINLGYIRSDSELIQAFSTVPSNAIVVFEDVDTQSTVLHQRANRMTRSPKPDQQEETDGFNLSTFLSILDGHTLEEGIIFIMTTNHKELLDPAVIRPGRMDSHFDLTYATHYQMRRIFSMAQLHDETLTLDDIYPDLEKNIPEFAIPPSEVMQTMVLYRDNLDEIPQQLDRLVERYLGSSYRK